MKTIEPKIQAFIIAVSSASKDNLPELEIEYHNELKSELRQLDFNNLKSLPKPEYNLAVTNQQLITALLAYIRSVIIYRENNDAARLEQTQLIPKSITQKEWLAWVSVLLKYDLLTDTALFVLNLLLIFDVVAINNNDLDKVMDTITPKSDDTTAFLEHIKQYILARKKLEH